MLYTVIQIILAILLLIIMAILSYSLFNKDVHTILNKLRNPKEGYNLIGENEILKTVKDPKTGKTSKILISKSIVEPEITNVGKSIHPVDFDKVVDKLDSLNSNVGKGAVNTIIFAVFVVLLGFGRAERAENVEFEVTFLRSRDTLETITTYARLM